MCDIPAAVMEKIKQNSKNYTSSKPMLSHFNPQAEGSFYITKKKKKCWIDGYSNLVRVHSTSCCSQSNRVKYTNFNIKRCRYVQT